MDAYSKCTGKRDKTRRPIRGPEGSHSPQSGTAALPMRSSFRSTSSLGAAVPAGVQGGRGQSSTRSGLAQCPAVRFQHIKLPLTFRLGNLAVSYGKSRKPMVTYGNRKNFLAPYHPPGPDETFHSSRTCRADLPRRLAAPTCRAEASERRREHPSEGGSIRAKAGAWRRRVTHQLIVTAKLDSFFTISIPNFKNTHRQPLPPNHLRKMPAETVKFCIDFPFRLTFYASRTCRAEASERRRVHAIVTSELHHSCTVSSPIFGNAFHYSLSSSHLQNPI
jgi:hypothetical protein